MKFLWLFILLSFLTLKSYGATCTAQASTNWTLASTWSCGSVPGCNDVIVIPAGFTVTINTAVDMTGGGCTGTKINIYGNLFFSGNASRLEVAATSTINIYSGGKITTDQPGNNSQKITIGSGSSEWSSNDGNLNGPWVITNGSSGPSTTLPIELIEFKGVCSSNEVELVWSTATEKINDYFILEKSLDIVNWDFVAKIPGNGTTSTIHNYSQTDKGINGLSYYRLSQVDKTGEKTTYTPIDVSCKTVSNNNMTLYPNPAASELKLSVTLDSAPSNGFIKIYNSTGELVMEKQVSLTSGYNPFVLPITLNNGIYYLEFSSENAALFNQRLIILN